MARAAAGDSAADIVAPLGFLALVLASWALRPASRKLAPDNSAGRASTNLSRSSGGVEQVAWVG